MEFGIALPTAADSWKVVQRAEELGFSHAWFYDTQMLCADCFVAMGAAAVKTSRLRLTQTDTTPIRPNLKMTNSVRTRSFPSRESV